MPFGPFKSDFEFFKKDAKKQLRPYIKMDIDNASAKELRQAVAELDEIIPQMIKITDKLAQNGGWKTRKRHNKALAADGTTLGSICAADIFLTGGIGTLGAVTFGVMKTIVNAPLSDEIKNARFSNFKYDLTDLQQGFKKALKSKQADTMHRISQKHAARRAFLAQARKDKLRDLQKQKNSTAPAVQKKPLKKTNPGFGA